MRWRRTAVAAKKRMKKKRKYLHIIDFIIPFTPLQIQIFILHFLIIAYLLRFLGTSRHPLLSDVP